LCRPPPFFPHDTPTPGPILNINNDAVKNLARWERVGVDASIGRSAANLLGLVTSVVALVLNADLLNVSGAGAGVDGSGIAVVGVDADQGASAVGDDTLELDVALKHLVAVSAGAVELAEVGDGEVGDVDGSAAVVLEDFVLGTLGSAADDLGGAGFLVEGEGVWGFLLVFISLLFYSILLLVSYMDGFLKM
jgi:hypothetical protein